MYNKMEASVGLSRKWDAREAGREVAEESIRKLNQPPSFFLLFSTIHYKNHGGFKEFLNGVWDVLPEGTPLIGGTVAAFLNNEGVFARGATALALSYSNIDVAIGLGEHVKHYPKKSAKNCINMIKKGLNKSEYKNKFLINIISGPTVPDLPIIGRINFIKSKFFGSLASTIGPKLFPFIGHGFGKEDDVIDYFSKAIPDYYIIGGSALDSGKLFTNYQFIGKQLHTNSIVALGCKIDSPIFLESNKATHDTDKTFEITGMTSSNRVITKINGKPAKEQFLKLLGIKEEQFNPEVFYSRTSNYFPITFEENRNYITGAAAFFGNNIALGYKARGKKARLLLSTGKEILNTVDATFGMQYADNLPFVLITSSSIFFNTLGSKAYFLKTKLDDYLVDTPYLMICPITENMGTPGEPAITRVYSFNAFSFKKLSR